MTRIQFSASRLAAFALVLAPALAPSIARAQGNASAAATAMGGNSTAVARNFNVEMPIAEQICKVIYEGAPAREAVAALMGRAIKREQQ